MNISGNELRKGDIILHENKLWHCLQSVHRTPGNLRAFMQAKLRNIKDGTQKDVRFSSTERLEKVEVFEREMQFLYNDGDVYHFMDNQNFEQVEINKAMLADNAVYLSPNMNVQITFYEGSPLGIKLPQTLEFEVVEADPEIKGATASSSFKSATLSTGQVVQVPQFVKVGDKVKVNTESGEYLERVKK